MLARELFDENYEEEPSGFVATQYICHECNASFCTSMRARVYNCVVCGSPSLTMDDYVESRTVKYIPFKKSDKDASRTFRRKTFWNPLVPFSFKFLKVKKHIQKVFLPAYLTDVNHNGIVVFIGGDKEKTIHNNRKCTEIKKYEVNQSINVDYKNVLLGVYSKINDKVFSNICAYDYRNLNEFNSRVVSDSFYVLGDSTITDVGDRGRNKIIKHSFSIARGNVRHTLKKLSKDQTTVVFQNTIEVLVPVYILTIQYRKKKYSFMMNGENGKSYVELPIGILSTCIFSIVITAIVFYITYLIACYY